MQKRVVQPFSCYSHDLVELDDGFDVGVIRNVGEDLGAMLREDGLEGSYRIDRDRRHTDEGGGRTGCGGNSAANFDLVSYRPPTGYACSCNSRNQTPRLLCLGRERLRIPLAGLPS